MHGIAHQGGTEVSYECVLCFSKVGDTLTVNENDALGVRMLMGKAHKNCKIGKIFSLHHITRTAFIIRLKCYVYIVENSETFQKIYSFMQFT